MDAALTLDHLQYPDATAPTRSTHTANSTAHLQHQLEQQRTLIEQHRQQLATLLPAPNTAQLPSRAQLQLQQQQAYFASEDPNSPASSSTSTPTWQYPRPAASSSRDAHNALADIRQQYQHYQSERQDQEVKRELFLPPSQSQQLPPQLQNAMAYNADSKRASSSGSDPTLPHTVPRAAEDPMPSTSDFVKKLYKMLEDPSFQSVVCWGPLGDCFVVKDMNEFTKAILPRMFKHSNFASFVRQLNKYDFHKVKNTDDNQFGEHSWTFRHPDFHADRRDALENIKRKVPAARKYTPAAAAAAGPSTLAPASASTTYPPSSSTGASYTYPSYGAPGPSSSSSALNNNNPNNNPSGGQGRRSPSPTHAHLTSEIARLKDEGDDLRGRIRALERNYESVLVELVGFQRGMAQQDGLLQSLVGWFLEGGRPPRLGSGPSTGSPAGHNQNTPRQQPVQEQSQQQQQQQEGASGSAHQKLRQKLQQLQAESRARGVGGGGALYPPLAPPSLSDPGLFLPPQAVQRMLGSSAGAGANGGVGVGGAGNDLGRATLMQMSELSRRGTMAWAGMDVGGAQGGFDAPGAGSTSAAPQSRTEQLAQIRDYYQQRQTASSTSSSAAAAAASSASAPPTHGRTGFSESRAREMPPLGGATPVSMEMDIGGGGGAMDEERGRRQQRRSSDTLAAHGALADAQQSPALAYSTASPWATTTPQFDAFSPQAQTLGPYPAPPSEGELMTHEGLQVYTVGHLLPRNTYVEDAQGNWSFDPGALTPPDSGLRMAGREQPGAGQGYGGGDEEGDAGEEVVRPTPSAPLGGASSSSATAQAHTSPELSASTPGVASASGPSGATQQKLRVRRSTFVPGWAVPPRVLLVDDDAVSRRLSSKFLKVFGCTTDVAVDGIGAVNKMNLEKYDLVLMDIVMPKLDGVSATNLIRKFDQGTPIISMTSNSKPNEIMTYYSSGMNDILPKPFTKEGLLDMLEKHLMHLKVIQQMSKLSRNIGIPPLSDANFEQALTQGANNLLMMPPPASSAASSPMNALVASSSSPSSSANPNVPSNAPSPFNFQFLGDGAGGEGGDGMGMSAMGRMNPLAGMGLTDEQYGVILQNIVNGDGFAGMMDGLDAAGVAGVGVGVGGMDAGEKRARLDEVEDKRGVKRSRFEVVE